MASLRDRLTRLQGRITPPPATPELPPSLMLTLRMMNQARAELDYQDRAHDEQGKLEAGEPPEPLELSLDEKRLMLESSRHFIDYLAEQRTKNPGVDTESIDRAERHTHDEIASLETEIGVLEMEGDES